VAQPEPQISIHLANFSRDGSGGWAARLFELARAADRAGIDRLAVSDHIVFGENLSAYADPSSGGTAGGKQPTGPDGHWLEPMILLAMLAGITERIRLSTSILLAALRRPAVLAKEAATLDVLSGGRLDLGVGIGWQREEYVAAGLDFHRRGDLLDHTLAVCQTLWRYEVAEFSDEYLRFERIHAMPKPVQPGGVPLWISGRINPRTVARVVRFGSGWIPWGDEISDPTDGIATLREALTDAGRDPIGLHVQGTLPAVVAGDGSLDASATCAPVAKLVAAGITDFRVASRWPPAGDGLDESLASIVEAFRNAARL
jgi:probable F420-dependent oxidoreductase